MVNFTELVNIVLNWFGEMHAIVNLGIDTRRDLTLN